MPAARAINWGMALPRRIVPSSAGRATGVLAFIACAQFLLLLDASIIYLALPSIGADLRLSVAGLSGVANSYTVAFAAALLLGGRLVDRCGPRQLLVLGLLGFAGAAAVGGTSDSVAVLVAARATQGLSAAALQPALLALVVREFAAGGARDRAVSIWGAASAAGGSVGAAAGGVVTGTLGWPAVLLLQVPLALGLLLVAVVSLAPQPQTSRWEPATFDVWGAFLATATVGTLLVAASSVERHGYVSADATTLFAAALAGASLLAVRARRHPNSVIPRRVWASSSMRFALTVGSLANSASFAAYFLLSLQLQRDQTMGPLEAGLTLLPFGLTAMVSSRWSSRLIALVGARGAIACGAVALCAGLCLLHLWPPDQGTVLDVILPTIVVGAGIGVASVGAATVALSEATERESGIVGGLLTTTQQVGGAVGITIAAVLFESAPQAGSDAFRDALVAPIALAAAAALLALSRQRSRQ